MSEWTKTRPPAPFVWHVMRGSVIVETGTRLVGEDPEVLHLPDDEALWYFALPPLSVKNSAREELRDALDLNSYSQLRFAATRLLAEPEIDAERLRKAMQQACNCPNPHDHTHAHTIAAAYSAQGGAT